MQVSSRVKSIAPSLTLQITSLAKKMKEQGQSLVNFAAGEPDFDTPEYIKEAAIKAIRQGQTKYTPASGILKLKEVICRKLEQDNSLRYSPSQIIVTCGAKHALYNILQVICEQGDEVVFANPYWVSYPQMINLAQASARIINTNAKDNFKFNGKGLKKNINKKTKVLILNSPGNPTGSVYTKQELLEIARVVVEKNIYVISDEIYEKLIFEGKQHISLASLNKQVFKQTIVVNGVSKAYAMTGWRIGYLACASAPIIEAVSNLQSHSTSNPCSISQMAAWEALSSNKRGQILKMNQEFQLRRDCMMDGLRKIARLSYTKPEGAFYLFCNISKVGLDSVNFARRLLAEVQVAVIPGKAFGRDDYVRLSFATSREQIEEGVGRIKDWIDKVT